MNLLKFEWGKKKEKANIKKHGVSFEDARTAFYDEHALLQSSGNSCTDHIRQDG